MKVNRWFTNVVFGIMVSCCAATTVHAETKSSGNALQGIHYLSHEVQIYVPSTVHEDKPAPTKLREQVLNDTLRTLSNLFGGATAVNGVGSWVDDHHKLVKENVTIVFADTDKLTNTEINAVVAYVKKLKKEMTQSSVTLVVDGKMYFI